MAKSSIKAITRLREAASLDHLQSIIANLDEGIVLLAPDETILWANDAALAMHGAQTLGDLGSSVSDFRKRYVLSKRGHAPLAHGKYPIDRAMAGEAFDGVTVEVTRAGKVGPEWVHRIRSLVLTDGEGHAECLALIIRNDTAQMVAERDFEQAFNANPAPALICRLSDLRFLRANQGFLEMTGFNEDAIVGRSLYEFDIFKHAADRDSAKQRLAKSETIPQMEAELDLPDGSVKLVIIAGQTIVLRDEPCMLFTFADLEPRRQAERALRHSEERFSGAFQLAPVAMVVASLRDHRLLNANAAFHEMTGHDESRVIGQTPSDLTLWDTAATRRRLESDLLASGRLSRVDARVSTKDGTLLDCLVSAAPISVGDDPCVLWVLQDITERRHSELELVAALDAVMQDATWFSRNVVEKLATLRAPKRTLSDDTDTELTKRERQVLELVCRGLDDDAIASDLSLSRNTVRNHVARIYGKIGVNKRGAAIVWARERGLAHNAASR
ncbi:PAS domain S-box protein [Polymorphobacter sp. PAMC 29334]|uniref:PAS domain S-box protein n=1 Tax=Polymorphobacter sp. PAMC 29334 TaxID=2862331 RepID=UPI001C75F531|nr:PAS domain S-box protein [Polymorphobacter sp. PAMC 29334]QYE33745.1 PAS domain S-box protein [Polymorphobacter sp. PAMC 29334]